MPEAYAALFLDGRAKVRPSNRHVVDRLGTSVFAGHNVLGISGEAVLAQIESFDLAFRWARAGGATKVAIVTAKLPINCAFRTPKPPP